MKYRYQENYMFAEKSMKDCTLDSAGCFLCISMSISYPSPTSCEPWSLTSTGCVCSATCPLASDWLGRWEVPAKEEKEGGR